MKNFQAQIEWRSPNSIKPYTRNNKKHTDSTVQKLADKIRKFGWDVPVVVDGDGVIIKGHRRYRAALLLKLKQIPLIVRTDLTPAEVKAARIADNRLAEDSAYDYEAIAQELEDLATFDPNFDLELTGFDPEEIEQYLDGQGTEEEKGKKGERGEGRGGGDEGDGGEDDSGEDTAESKSPPEKYPLAIVLTAGQKQQWDGFKAVLDEKNDTKALLKIMELGVRLK